MNELTKKILESGLVDETTASLMEKWGVLEEGASELTKKARLSEATRDELVKFAGELEVEIEKRKKLRETMLDLSQLRWPVKVEVWGNPHEESPRVRNLDGVIDRMGRYYFRPADVRKNWFVPGFRIRRETKHLSEDPQPEIIMEVSELMIGDEIAAIQVSVK